MMTFLMYLFQNLTLIDLFLIPKGLSPFFSKNTPNLPFLAQEVQMNFFLLFCTFNHRILLQTTRRTCAKSFAKVDHMDCEIIMSEVERKVFFFLYSAGTTNFDYRLCKIFELCNFEFLHHLNAHYIRYLCTKSQRQGMSGTYSNAPCIEEGYRIFPLYQQFLRIFLRVLFFSRQKFQQWI